MNHAKDVDELKSLLLKDKKYAARFPVRFILIEGARQWQVALDLLKEMTNEVFRLSEYCAGDDQFPDLFRLMNDVRSVSGVDSLIIPLSEYLRLFGDMRGVLRELAVLQKTSGLNAGTNDRIYVPLLGVDDIFFEQMDGVSRFGKVGECAEYYVLDSDKDEQKISLKITANRPYGITLTEDMVDGIKQFLQLWEKRAGLDLWLVTQLANYIRETSGIYDVAVYDNSFEMLMERIEDADILKRSWGNEEQWRWLLSILDNRRNLNNLFAKEFNMRDFDIHGLFTRWNEYDPNHKWLAWLWCKIKQPGGYMAYVIQSDHFDEFEANMIFGIIDMVSKGLIDDETELADIIKERKQLMECIGIRHIPDRFWERFGTIDNNVKKLKCLSCITEDEKYRAIEIADRLLRDGVDESKWFDLFSIIYPELAYYLSTVDYGCEDVSEYFHSYVRAKISDEITTDMQRLVEDMVDKHILWNYQSRCDFLQQFNEQAMVYWADGMGAEWLGLIEGILRDDFENVAYECRVARANLPTTTEFNKDWEGTDNYKEYKDYDSLVHSYDCRYPKYIIEEFNHITNIVKNALALLDSNETVIITADHGTSRLAAIDKQSSVPVPEHIKVEKHGRYCINDGSLNAADYKGCIENNDKLIFANYHRFKIGGHVAGEIHGGATLEEVLVPIVIMRKRGKEEAVTFRLKSSSLRVDIKGQAIMDIIIEGGLKDLILISEGRRFKADDKKDGHWQIAIRGLKIGKHSGILIGDGKKIGEITFELIKAMTQNDMGL